MIAKQLLISVLSISLLQAADVTYTGVTGGEWATGGNWSSGNYPTSTDAAVLDTTVNLSVPVPNNIQSIHIGTNGTGRLQIGSRATLTASSTSSKTSSIGSGSGNEGSVQQEGGMVDINRLEIGRNASTGTYHMHAGTFSISRETQSYSLFLGTNTGRSESGNGTFRISSGSFETRAGVYLGSTTGGIGRFEVIGSHPGSIGIGSGGNNLDGIWTQNSGSTLSVRIDKTLQGVTPIFVDDRGQDGGGDGNVIFESGALLEVDFTAAFLNGGTFTVMEWEGEVTDNGLQFAPSVDTNIWSFEVDPAGKRLTVTATGNPISRNFVHPGLAHKLSDLERMRDMVAAGIEPYASSFASLSATGRAQHTYQPSSAAADLDTNGGTANNNALRNDGVAAYYNALMWFITGDERHAEASIRIFTAWSGVKNIDGIPLNAGRHWRLIEAAEIIKSTYSGWAPGDLQAFKDMLVYPGYSNTTEPSGDRSIYWRAFQGDPARHGNQGLFAMRCVMAIGVFLDNEIMYDRALRYLQGAPARSDDIPYVSGPSIANTQIATYEHFLEYSRSGEESTISDYGYNEVIHNYIYPNGQSQEFSRDMAHGLAGIGIIATMSEMAWSQGDDLYGYLENRPLLGLEYYYRYNLSFLNTFPDQATSWEPTVENGEFIQRLDQSGRWFSLKANPYLAQNVGPENLLRGKFNDDPVYEMNLAHYRDRIGVPSDDTKWLQRGLDLLIADENFEGEGTPWDHPSWGSLTFRRISPGDPVQGFSNGVPDFAMNVLPTAIEAENYDYFPLDGEGRTYHDLSIGNSGTSYRPVDGVDIASASEGGFALTSIEAGEWVTYTVSAPATGTYDISIRYASTAPGGTIQFSFDGVDVTGNVTIPNGAPASSGASDWQDLVIATDVPLTQGVQQLRVNFGGTSNAFLLNRITIDRENDALVGHWSFNEGSGTVATDCSGNDHHGTIENATWVESDGRRALDFNGSSSTVVLPVTAFESVSDQVSVAMWTYGDPAGNPAESSAFYAYNRNNRVLNVHLPWSDSQVYWDAPNRIKHLATEAEFEGSWTHWVFTSNTNSGVMNIYRNGQLWHTATTGTGTIGTISGGRIGSQVDQAFYDGMIDEVQLYKVALNAGEVASLYENTSLPDTIGLTGDVQVATTRSETAPSVSTTDLAQTQYLSSSATGGETVETRHAELFNGIIGDNDSGTGDPGVVRMTSANTLTIELDTSINTLGYNISGITSVFGWNPDNGGRSNQGYEIIVTFVDDTTATLAGPSHWEPNNPASYWTTVSFNPSNGTSMASGVKAITFDITEDANANGVVIAREIDIFGSPTVAPDHEEVLEGGESLDVVMTSPTGTPGIDWSLYTFDCILVLDDTATSGNPFTFNLLADSLPGFDSTQNQAWLIVTAENIAGTFDSSAFIVDASGFESSNATNGGQFAIGQTGSQLFLNFTAAARSFLEQWRFANFGTYDNEGIAADDYDADFDGVFNLLEYATGLDPNDPGDSSVLVLRESLTNPGELEVSFNRIDDPALTYTLQGSETLSGVSLDTILSTTGIANDTVTTPQSEWPSHTNYFFRLQVTY